MYRKVRSRRHRPNINTSLTTAFLFSAFILMIIHPAYLPLSGRSFFCFWFQCISCILRQYRFFRSFTEQNSQSDRTAADECRQCGTRHINSNSPLTSLLLLLTRLMNVSHCSTMFLPVDFYWTPADLQL